MGKNIPEQLLKLLETTKFYVLTISVLYRKNSKFKSFKAIFYEHQFNHTVILDLIESSKKNKYHTESISQTYN